MPLNRGTQKQIAQRFKGNLDYFRKAHYWRRLRFLTILVVCVIGGVAIACFFFAGSQGMYNPGAISQHHAQFASDCAHCHETPGKALTQASFKFSNHAIDQRCEKCHAGHSFHEATVVHARSCTACHQEHQGNGPMAAPTDAQCLKCHGTAHEMQASAEKGKTLPPEAFASRVHPGWEMFSMPRPAEGFTKVLTSFAGDHPEFRWASDKLRETNTLKFNHRRHLADTNDMPLVNGRRLNCAYCHVPGAGGAYFQRITYEQQCRTCHSLQFDDHNPTMALPHGRADHVGAFLRSLPNQYAALARQQGKTAADIDEFVAAQMLRLREGFETGEKFERKVFFATSRNSPEGREKFDGCATCHEVKERAAGVPEITRPAVPERWMAHARFNHSKHSSVACVKCHSATKSSDTADILLPTKSACVECHSPKGKVANNCSFCHSYHAPNSTMTETR